MANDEYIVGRLYVPIFIIIILVIMIYFHRRHFLKYLYILNILLCITTIISYFILVNHPIGEKFSNPLMNILPFVWLIATFSSYSLCIVSCMVFIIEQAQRHIWARIMLIIIGLAHIVCFIIFIYWFVLGILSLQSG